MQSTTMHSRSGYRVTSILDSDSFDVGRMHANDAKLLIWTYLEFHLYRFQGSSVGFDLTRSEHARVTPASKFLDVHVQNDVDGHALRDRRSHGKT